MSATISHGSNAECPDVQSGRATHCPTHQDERPRFKSGLYKCATCKEVCAEPEALRLVIDVLKRVSLHMKNGDALPLLLRQDIELAVERFKTA
jgi:hypothetical protein